MELKISPELQREIEAAREWGRAGGCSWPRTTASRRRAKWSTSTSGSTTRDCCTGEARPPKTGQTVRRGWAALGCGVCPERLLAVYRTLHALIDLVPSYLGGRLGQDFEIEPLEGNSRGSRRLKKPGMLKQGLRGKVSSNTRETITFTFIGPKRGRSLPSRPK